MRILTGILILSFMLIAYLLNAGECKDYVELKSVKFYERKYKKSATWILNNVKIDLWEKSTPQGKGKKTGSMLPRSRAVIIEKGPEDYKVMNTLDGSIGWVENMYVDGVLKLDTVTMKPCE